MRIGRHVVPTAADQFGIVIPGAERSEEPGTHIRLGKDRAMRDRTDRGYWFRARRFAAPRNDVVLAQNACETSPRPFGESCPSENWASIVASSRGHGMEALMTRARRRFLQLAASAAAAPLA